MAGIRSQAKHKFCRRIGTCIWGSPKCPSVKRPYAAGQHGKTARRKKLSTYGTLLLEKQKLRFHYAISEKQLQIAYAKAKKGEGQAHEKLFRNLEQRLAAVKGSLSFAVVHNTLGDTGPNTRDTGQERRTCGVEVDSDVVDATLHNLVELALEQALKNAEKDAGAPIELKGFVRFQLGEGIEKEADNFADEVASMTKGA